MENQRGRDFIPKEAPASCEQFFRSNRAGLEHTAFEAMRKRGLTPDQFIVVAIDLSDPLWIGVANVLMSDVNWGKLRAQEKISVAKCIIEGQEAISFFSTTLPPIASVLARSRPMGTVSTIIMAGDRVSVRPITPFPHYEG